MGRFSHTHTRTHALLRQQPCLCFLGGPAPFSRFSRPFPRLLPFSPGAAAGVSMGDAVSISAAPTALVQDLRIQHVQNVPKTIALSQNAQLTIDSTVFTASNAGQAFRCSGQGMYNETLRACQCFDQATPRDKNCAPLYVNYDVTAAVGTDILDGVYRPLKYADVLKTGMEIAALAPVYDRMVAFRRNDDRYQGTLLAVKHADDRRREPQTPPPQFRGYFWVVHRITQPQGTAGMPLLRSALVSTPHPPPSTTGWYLMDPDHPAESLDMVQALPSYDPSLEATDVRLAAGAVVPQPGPSPPSKGGASSTTVAMAAAIAGAVAFLVTLLLVAERRRRSRQGRRKAGRGGASGKGEEGDPGGKSSEAAKASKGEVAFSLQWMPPARVFPEGKLFPRVSSY